MSKMSKPIKKAQRELSEQYLEHLETIAATAARLVAVLQEAEQDGVHYDLTGGRGATSSEIQEDSDDQDEEEGEDTTGLTGAVKELALFAGVPVRKLPGWILDRPILLGDVLQ